MLAASGVAIKQVRPPSQEEIEEATLRAKAMAAEPSIRAQALLTQARETGDWTGIPNDTIVAEAQRVIVTTTEGIPGREVAEIRGIISSEYTYAFGAIFEEFAGLLRNIAGSGKSSMTTKFLREGRLQVVNSLRYEALDAGANAVVGVRIEYEEFSGANQRGILVVVATGTAVKLGQA
ncbi:MAG: YbjQ family protein [Rhizobacter sp.]